jgi:hypothetical protein
MLKQDFTSKEFSCLVQRGDYSKYFKSDLNTDEKSDELKNRLLQEIEDSLNISVHSFTSLKQVIIKKKIAYMLEKIKFDKSNLKQVITDDFILRKANKNIRRIYDVRQADRFKIITNVKSLLSENVPFYVCKTDIRNFYESIDRAKIYDDMRASSILSHDTKYVLEKLFNHPILENFYGLPRGINLSATLSEYFMRPFDKEIRKIDGCFYYARYVDDIILFSTKEITKQTIKQITNILPQGLQLNMQKTRFMEFGLGSKIQFLGYEFVKDKNNHLNTTIAPKKILKIKERIVKAFLTFSKDHNFRLLQDRLLFLSANYPLKTSRQKLSKYENVDYLRGGIAYNYPLIDDFSCLHKLDTFLHQVIKTEMFARMNRNLTQLQKNILQKYSFYFGFQRHITRWFTPNRIAKITKCWE